MTQKIKVRFLILHYLPIYSGAAGSLNKLINSLNKDKFEVEIVTTHIKGYKRKDTLEEVKIYRIGYGFFGKDQLLNSYGKLCFFISLFFFSCFSKKYDILHLIGSGKLALPALFFSKIYNKKKVNKITRVGDDDPLSMGGSFLGKIVNSFLSKNTKHIIISPQIMDICNKQLNWDKSSFYLIPNPVDIKFANLNELIKIRSLTFENEVPKIKKFLFVGVIAEHKGIHILVHLWNKYNFNGKLIICGVPLPSGGSDEIIENINKNDNVIWKGRLNKEELQQEYLSSDVFLFPTFVEGLPNVMLEAMSFGLPCVANKISGVTDYLLGENRGVLVEGNNSEIWKKIIDEIITSNDSTKKKHIEMSSKAFDWVCVNADSKTISNKIQNLYM